MKGQPILVARLKNEIQADIHIGSIPGFVPEYHVMQASAAAGYQYFGNWQTLSWQDRAQLVALHFAKMLVERHAQDAVNTAVEKQRRQRSARSKRK